MSHVDLFDYHLPAWAIAQTPAEPRDAARLMVSLRPLQPPRHKHVRDLPDVLKPGDLLVVNDTRVRPARLHLRKETGGAAEVLLLEPAGDDGDDGGDRWEALVRPGRRLAPGTVLLADDDTPVVEVGEPVAATDDDTDDSDDTDDGRRLVRVLADPDRYGTVPLPPYIAAPPADPERYQTVYASRPASVAAPTAGLHLTDDVLARCKEKGIEVARVELVVGLDTFRPIAVEWLEDHVMHSERYSVPPETMEACARAKRVVAVGTTVVRALESAALGKLEGRTDLFICGDYPFKVVDLLLTNFHLPRSTLLVLLEAFYGPGWRGLYEQALEGGYNFLSFGDAMLLARRRKKARS